MRRLRRAMGLSAAERRLALTAYGGLWLVVLCLRVCRLRLTRRAAARAARLLALLRRRRHLLPDSPDVVSWAIAAASSCVPGATCLAQALTGQLLLAAQSTESTLHVGVARGQSGGLDAHAWLECMGRIIVGGADVGHYARLLAIDLG